MPVGKSIASAFLVLRRIAICASLDGEEYSIPAQDVKRGWDCPPIMMANRL